MELEDAIRHRRSLKPDQMRADPVDRALLMRMFEAANWAPSHGLTEPWRFIVFEGEARRALAEAAVSTLVEGEGATLPAGDPRRLKLVKNMTTPPVTVAIVCATSANPKIVEHEEIASTAMAVMSAQLVARSLGLATFWTSGEKAFHPKMARFLGLEPPHRCLGFLYVGWPAVPWPEATRGPIREKLSFRA